MPRINEHYLNLRAAYLFAEIRRRQAAFTTAHPAARVIDLGVGDVTRPLPPAVVRSLHDAADDIARPESFKGYGPYVGYEWVRADVAAHDFGPGVRLARDILRDGSGALIVGGSAWETTPWRAVQRAATAGARAS